MVTAGELQKLLIFYSFHVNICFSCLTVDITHQIQGLGKLVRKQVRMDISGKEGEVEARQQGGLRQEPWKRGTVPLCLNRKGRVGPMTGAFFIQQPSEKRVVPIQL